MKTLLYILLLFTMFSCTQEQAVQETPKTEIPAWVPYDESEEIAANAEHETRRLRYKLIQSKISDRNDVWKVVEPQISNFSEEDYQSLKPLILDQDIPTMQSHIASGKLSYEKLTQWYLFRIAKYENNKDTYLNAIISINPNAVKEAQAKDQARSENDHPIFGMPILLKDNINTEGMKTTAGAHVLQNNQTTDAFIIERIKEKGGIILGKVSLSEWANFLCIGCPNGYSAIAGQTLNPYGRKQFDTGGSSSGSGVSMAANYAAAAVGTETSGSILSPSSSSSLVGLKPTIGLLSRSGIVPISSTLDTPGPMTRNVTDNAILLSAMSGEDSADVATKDNPKGINYYEDLNSISLEGLRFGVNKNFLEDSIYKMTVEKLQTLGAETIEFEPIEVNYDGFASILRADMKIDLKNYLENYASPTITQKSVADVVAFNEKDSLVSIPYGQGRFQGILEEEITPEELEEVKTRIENEGRRFFNTPMEEHQLDAVLSINNWNAGYAAGAKYPCLTIPMGYRESGQPAGLTFIGKPFEEDKLLKIAYAFEQATKVRTSPKGYN